MLDADLLVLDLEAETSREVIEHLGRLMKEKEYVKDSYVEAVLTRESTLPTGLSIGNFYVAIPHTDSNHVNRSTIGLAALKKPVAFHSMINPEESLAVELVFLLAIKDPGMQVQTLKNLMAVFQNKELLMALKAATTREQAAELLQSLAV